MNPRRYDYASFTLDNGESDYDVGTEISALFSNIKEANRLIIKTNQNITCKLNSTLLPAFPIGIGDSPFQLPPNYADVNDIFLSNASGQNATVQIWLFG